MNIFATLINRWRNKQTQESNWDIALRWIMVAMVFLVPIFFLPQSTYAGEFNKVLLFDILMLVAAVVFLLKILVRRQASFKISKFDWLVLAFVILNLISFIFSQNHYTSMIGNSGYFNGGMITIFCLAVFFFLLRQVIRDKKDIIGLLVVLLVSSIITVVYNYFQLFGLHLLPWQVTKNINFNAVDMTADGYGVFLSFCILISFGLMILAQKKYQRILCSVFLGLSVILLFLLDQRIAYYLLALSFFVYLLFITIRSKYFANIWVILPTLILTLVVLFSFVNSSQFTKISLDKNLSLDTRTSMAVAWSSFLHAPLWGSGQQTFTQDLAKYRTDYFNNSSQWNLSFIRGSNEWTTSLATLGLGGMGVFLALIIWYFIISFKWLFYNQKVDDNWNLQMTIFVAWLLLLITSFFLPLNFVLMFTWWLIMTLGIMLMPGSIKTTKNISIATPSWRNIVSIVIFVVVTVGVVLMIIYFVNIWVADRYFSQAQDDIAGRVDIAVVVSKLEKAVKLDGQDSFYRLTLAQGYATQAQLEAAKTSPDSTKIQQSTQKVVDTLKQARTIDPSNPYVYEQEATIYSSLRNIISNADSLASNAFEQALNYEPASPMAYLNLGRAELLSAQTQLSALAAGADKSVINQLINKAIVDLEKAKTLKKELPLAEYSIAVGLELKGEQDQAIVRMEALANKYPTDLDILSGLASLYQQKESYDQAIAVYHQVLKLSPNDDNTHWQLALIYEKQGKNDLALAELQIVKTANPDNTTVQQEIDKVNKALKK